MGLQQVFREPWLRKSGQKHNNANPEINISPLKELAGGEISCGTLSARPQKRLGGPRP